MKVLVFHGYLLRGTGSNIYNASLAAALAALGHEVHLMCQDRDAAALPFVDAVGRWREGRLEVEVMREPVRVTAYLPDIGTTLPVYVADEYEGFDARPFPALDDAEVERYIAANVAAASELIGRVGPDAALANHAIAGPVILARAGAGRLPLAVKIHGSALEYTVKQHPVRFLPLLREGLEAASGVLVGSRHTAESLWATLDDPSVPPRTRLGPPGVDVVEFAPRDAEAAREGLRDLAERLGRERKGTEEFLSRSSFSRDPGEAGEALQALEPGRDRLVVFVGKLIASKGGELLLAAWPLVLAAEPRARLVVVGFGDMRQGLEQLGRDLAAGDVEAARQARGELGQDLPWLQAFLEAPPDGYGAPDARTVWTGRLDHHELADLLPASEALVMPSTFPEAFGMVAAEAAACGALPVVAHHSGMAEVSNARAATVSPEARAWLSFEVGPGAVRALAGCLIGWLGAEERLRAATREAFVAETRRRWSWDGVARTVIAAAQGDLARLPSV